MMNMLKKKAKSPRQHFPSSFDEFENWFRESVPASWKESAAFSWFENEQLPKVDLIERETDILVKAEMPGIKKEDIDVSISGHRLTIKAKTESEKTEEKEEGNYHYQEISRGEYQRTIMLPEEVNTEAAKATFNDGVMELVLPKIEPEKRQKIEIG